MTALTLMLIVSSGEGLPAQATQARPDMVLKWNDVALQTIRHTKTPPPIAARNLAIMHLAIYDAVMAIERTHEPYLVEATAAPGTLPEAAAAAAAHRVLVALYPKQKDVLDRIIAECGDEIPKTVGRDLGAELGRMVADRILEARRDDGASRDGRYAFKRGPGLWVPTAPGRQDALLPEWGWVKPFAIKKGTMHRPAGPPSLHSAAYADAFHEVRRLGEKDSKTRTEEQTQIALFWADNAGTVTPPGHWNQIAQSLALDRKTTLAENARIFAHLNISLADAGVLCWVIKFTFEFWRPITAIQANGEDGWTPLLETPPFPAYVSGHSTFSSAAAVSLAHSFGSDKIRFATISDGSPGVVRKFDSLWSAAEEAGMSRIYGGIHWQFDNTDGLAVGRTIGDYVARNTLRPRSRGRQALYPPVIIDR